ncbi:MAG: hypothetical protein K2K00_01705 [Muribaculaceae bacterium]|nr:hypothetical protein [Muribaculaceae bacterium]
MKKLLFTVACAATVLAVASCSRKASEVVAQQPEYLCIAYAHESDGPLPPADMVTGINYLAAYPNEAGDGLRIVNIPRLMKILKLKEENPELKVVLSFGGAGAGSTGWTEMVCNDSLRASFVADCKRVTEQYGLDGLDFDWEFPHTQEELDGYISLFKEVRESLGDEKLVTAAAGFWGNGFDLKEAMKYLDYINLMTYDMGWQAPYHHTSLHRSDLSGVCTVDEALDSCLSKGVEYKDIVLGLAFYGRGDGKNFKAWTDYRDIALREGMEERWDSVACVPYIVDSLGTLIIGYENPQSLKIKCDYIKEKGLRGGMYWRTEEDADDHQLTRAVAEGLMGR